LKLTPLGRRIRATVQNRQLAESSGISTRATDRLTFFIGSGLAGVAGVALTLMGSISPNLGTSYIVDAFLVVVVGGIGQLRGAVIAAFVLGVAQSWIEYSTTASIAKVLLFVLIIAFLQLRPQGIYNVRSRSLA
jgi:urea transport system permease protein